MRSLFLQNNYKKKNCDVQQNFGNNPPRFQRPPHPLAKKPQNTSLKLGWTYTSVGLVFPFKIKYSSLELVKAFSILEGTIVLYTLVELQDVSESGDIMNSLCPLYNKPIFPFLSPPPTHRICAHTH